MPDKLEVQDLAKRLEATTKATKQIHLIYLGGMTFNVITVWALSHRQMVISEEIRLPILDLSVPLFFYILFSPLLLIILGIYFFYYVDTLKDYVETAKKKGMDNSKMYLWMVLERLLGDEARKTALRESRKALWFYRLRNFLRIRIGELATWHFLPFVLVIMSLKFLPLHDAKVSWYLIGNQVLAVVAAEYFRLKFFRWDRRRNYSLAEKQKILRRRRRRLFNLRKKKSKGRLLTLPFNPNLYNKRISRILLGRQQRYLFLGIIIFFWILQITLIQVDGPRNLLGLPTCLELSTARISDTGDPESGQIQMVLDDRDFSRADFSYAWLINCRLWNCNFRGSTMIQAHLSGSQCVNCNFSFSNLTGADLSHCNLRGADFTGANLEGVNFENANLEQARFDRTILRDAKMITARNMKFTQLSIARSLYGTQLPQRIINKLEKEGLGALIYEPRYISFLNGDVE